MNPTNPCYLLSTLTWQVASLRFSQCTIQYNLYGNSFPFTKCHVLLYSPILSCVYIGMQQILTRIGDKAKVASVLLLTDGQANVGPSSIGSILDAMKNPMAHGVQQSNSHQNVPDNRSRQRFNPFGVSNSLYVLVYSEYSLICHGDHFICQITL